MDDNNNEMDIIESHVVQAANHIKAGFRWDRTPEGPAYWCTIHKRLTEMGREARLTRISKLVG